MFKHKTHLYLQSEKALRNSPFCLRKGLGAAYVDDIQPVGDHPAYELSGARVKIKVHYAEALRPAVHQGESLFRRDNVYAAERVAAELRDILPRSRALYLTGQDIGPADQPHIIVKQKITV